MAELRAAGVGVRRMLMAHDGSLTSHDLFETILTMLDPKVMLQVVVVPSEKLAALEARKQHRSGSAMGQTAGPRRGDSGAPGEPGPEFVRLAREEHYDLIARGVSRALVGSDPRPAANPLARPYPGTRRLPGLRRRPAGNSNGGGCLKFSPSALSTLDSWIVCHWLCQ